MKILFISRKYPPQIGGMESYAYNLIKYFPGHKKTILLKKRNIHLVWFLPYALIRGVFLASKVDIIYLCDSVLAPIGFVIKLLTGRPVMATAHGLDIIYNNWLYQSFNIPFVKYLDKIIAVSRSTLAECIKRGVSKEKCIFIPNGVDYLQFQSDKSDKEAREIIEKQFDLSLKGKHILITVGRLVKRKGIQWFIENVIPQLSDNIFYLIIGSGTEKDNIQNTIVQQRLNKKVKMLGKVSDQDLRLLYKAADLFIMPNIQVKGDCEGFGLVALEATSCGIPVIASDLEGIRDAIHEDRNGFLVRPGDKEGFIKKIMELKNISDLSDLGRKFSIYTNDFFSWDKSIGHYNDVVTSIISDRNL